MNWKTSIDLMIEDGKTLQRLYEKGWIDAETLSRYLAPLVVDMEIWRGLERMEETVSGPRYSLSGVLEDLAMRQLLTAHDAVEGGSYVL